MLEELFANHEIALRRGSVFDISPPPQDLTGLRDHERMEGALLGHLFWEVLRRPLGDAPAPEWWLDEFLRVAGDLAPWPWPFQLSSDAVPAYFRDFDGTLCEFINTRVRAAYRRGVSLRDACSITGFGSGADCVQSIPAVLYVWMHHADSFELAVIAAVNDTKDNDTVASIVGAIAGALHGRRAIRRRWLDGITSTHLGEPGRAENDRSVIDRLTAQAVEQFV
jgi:hypothetical protein